MLELPATCPGDCKGNAAKFVPGAPVSSGLGLAIGPISLGQSSFNADKIRMRSLVFLLLITLCAISQGITLFTPEGRLVDDYDKQVEKLARGKSIEIEGISYTIDTINLTGRATAVLSLKPPHQDKMLRIPRQSSKLTYQEMWVGGHKILGELGIPIPKMYASSSKGYALIEKVDILGGGDSSVNTIEEMIDQLPRDVRAKAKKDLKVFIQKLAPLTRISDLRPNQLAYTPSGWILLDWSSYIELYDPSHPEKKPDVLERLFGVDIALTHEMHAAYFEAQKQLSQKDQEANYQRLLNKFKADLTATPLERSCQCGLLASFPNPSDEADRWVASLVKEAEAISDPLEKVWLQNGIRDYFFPPFGQIRLKKIPEDVGKRLAVYAVENTLSDWIRFFLDKGAEKRFENLPAILDHEQAPGTSTCINVPKHF